MPRLSHPDIPFELEHVGQEVICHYPEGATAIAGRAEWLAMLLLDRLDKLIENRPATPVVEGPVLEQVLETVDKAISEPRSKKKG